MKFQQLQENLRALLWQRIENGELTGLRLAHETGFQQAHISNFLNRKRGLSLEGMDKVLASQKLSVLDLLEQAEINKRASIPPPAGEGFENILFVDAPTAANEAVITSEKVRDIVGFKRSFLRRLKPDLQTPRDNWTRFVLIRVGSDRASMDPRVPSGATVLIDRYYNSLRPYRKNEPNIYAVRMDGDLCLGYVEVTGRSLLVRPHNQAHPIDIIAIDDSRSYADYLVGRVCHVGIET